MAVPRSDRVGVLVVRMWLEGPKLCARVSSTSDVARPELAPRTLLAAGIEETCASVCRCVRRFAEDAVVEDDGA